MENRYSRIIDLLRGMPDVRLFQNEPMSRHTTFRIGGPAALFIEIGTIASLVYIKKILTEDGIESFIIGNGSNLLISDKGYSGVVLKFCGDSYQIDRNIIRAEAGISLKNLAVIAMNAGLSGLEFAHGIPGSVGGAVFMNAGAYGGEISNVLVESEYADEKGRIKKLTRGEHCFGYRNSYYKTNSNLMILTASFALTPDDKTEISARMQEFMQRRRIKQPLEFPSAGSVFKRPKGYFAGTLIEECGLKGCTVGGARVSDKHAGFIINIGGATCSDVEALIEKIQQTVLLQKGITLECEIRRI